MTFSCNEGYDIQGSSRVTCDANGLWSDFTPRCIPSKASLENDSTVNLFCYSLCHFDIGRPCSYIFGWEVLPLMIVKKGWIEKQNQTFIEHSWFCAYLKLVFSFHVFFQVVEWWFLNLIWWAAHLPLQTILEIMATTEAAPGFPGLGKVYITFWWLNTVNTDFSVRFFVIVGIEIILLIVGYSIYIEFTDFSLESHPTCKYDYLLIGTERYDFRKMTSWNLYV